MSARVQKNVLHSVGDLWIAARSVFSTLQKHFANVLEPPLDAGTDRHILGLVLGALL
jgi:hypothetical protein